MADMPGLDSFDLSNPLKPTKIVDNNAKLDFTENWSKWVDQISEPITEAEIILSDPAMILFRTTAIDGPGKNVTAWIDFAGLADQTVHATFRVGTALGRQDDRTLYFKLKSR